MTFNQMLPTLQSQASRIFRGDEDSMQDALGMAYANYNSCLARKNRQLSIGECVNFMKHRSTELNNGHRPHIGNRSTRRTNDVYFKQAYLRGDVELLSFDFEDSENEEGDKGPLVFQTRVSSNENDILFNIDFTKFREQLNRSERELLDWFVYGLNPMEISRAMQLKYHDVRARLKAIGLKFGQFFQYQDFALGSD